MVFGIAGGRLFDSSPGWVDAQKRPGWTSQRKDVGVKQALKEVFTFNNIINGPNGAWMVIAMISHIFFPYGHDQQTHRDFEPGWILHRVMINFCLFVAYYGFFSLGLYAFRWSKRKYKPGHVASTARMLHNIWYSSLASVQLSLWEVLYMHMWANGKLAVASDAEWLSTTRGAAAFIGWTIALPVIHDVHFYFIHRFLHLRPMYKFVHSLHHRNPDPEPFSGLCMHPVEHLFFFSVLGLSCFVDLAPWHLRWNALWLLLAPGASHGGYEDVWNQDQFHYLHHARFECNYGSPGFPMDKVFGTARYSLDPKDQATYTGAGKDIPGGAQDDLKSAPSLGWSSGGPIRLADAMPKASDFCYTVFYTAAAATFIAHLTGHGTALSPHTVALLCSLGPVLFAIILCKLSGDKLPLQWPFHKENFLGSFGLHMMFGLTCAVVPVYQLVVTALS